jgi:hypothetical protein
MHRRQKPGKIPKPRIAVKVLDGLKEFTNFLFGYLVYRPCFSGLLPFPYDPAIDKDAIKPFTAESRRLIFPASGLGHKSTARLSLSRLQTNSRR